MSTPNRSQTLKDGLRLKCPRCGEGDLFATMFRMKTDCSNCRFKFEREPGYFVGAMYINYGATVFIAFGGYFALDYFTRSRFPPKLHLLDCFQWPLPCLFLSYSRSLWLSFDHMFNPSGIE